MHEIVDSLVIPARVAGDPALELCNTRAGWGDPTPKEYLVSYDHLLVWAREVGLIDADLVEPLRPGSTSTTTSQATRTHRCGTRSCAGSSRRPRR